MPTPDAPPPPGTLHHLELYVSDLETTIGWWGWLLTELGYAPYQEWDEGMSWRLGGGTYLVFVQAPDPGDGFDRRHVGINHLAFHAGDRSEVDRLSRGLVERGARLLYGDRHPYAGGADHYAAFLEDPDGVKVELVASG
jgi:catechol 2,3-dioxygenase-like lactoylglutathione lyase family enzyme